MKTLAYYIPAIFILTFASGFEFSDSSYDGPVFDVHLHGRLDAEKAKTDLKEFQDNNIVAGAITCPFNTQQYYRNVKATKFLYGLMLPCPNGKVPYGGPSCFEDGREYPPVKWVRQQMIEKKIDYLGELINQYYGISMSDTTMYPYYSLAEEFDIPVGIHSGLAGPDHGCPNFDPKMGDPALLKPMLERFPKVRVWIMHAGMPYLDGTLEVMKRYPRVYADISVIANPDIVPKPAFDDYMKKLVDAGLVDQLMFGSDGGNISRMKAQVNSIDFLSAKDKEKIFYSNARRFFRQR